MISVIIPTYNRGRLIRRSVESVLAQTWNDLEVIIVDDGSTDDTFQVVQGMEDARVRYLRMPRNSGASAARNYGVQNAKGHLIAFQDSDDQWLPEKLETQMRHFEQSGADVVFCAFERYAVNGDFSQVTPGPEIAPGKVTHEQLLYENFISTQTILGKKACFLDEPFDETIPALDDWEIMLRIARKYYVFYGADVLVRLFEQSDSLTGNSAKGRKAIDSIWKMHYADIQANDRTMLHLLYQREHFHRASGAPCCGMYFREISPKHRLKTNLYLFLHSLRMLRIDLIR